MAMNAATVTDAVSGASSSSASDRPLSPPSPLGDDGDQHMIILYYCYPPSGIPPECLHTHASFHEESCARLDLRGRIRVSGEGINGVLSGGEGCLREYEGLLRGELLRVARSGGVVEECVSRAADADNNDRDVDAGEIDAGDDSACNHDNVDEGSKGEHRGKERHDPTAEWLDVKYCHLREDVPTEKQLFDSLSVKITREVVSLIEPKEGGGRANRGRARCRQRRRQRRKEKQRLEKPKESARGENGTVGAQEGREAEGSSSTNGESEIPHVDPTRGGGAPESNGTTEELGTALAIRDWEKCAPAVHLSPREWNEELLWSSRGERRRGDDSESGPSAVAAGRRPTGREEGEAVLLDARNVYETRVGHFAVPGLRTVFPNTRKFSSLPSALNTEEAAAALAGKRVFMYCTGGVRCERAGSYLRALSESNAGAWKGKAQPKGIYQLRGGIQKYLELYGSVQSDQTNRRGDDESSTREMDFAECRSSEGTGEGDGREGDAANNSRINRPCLYRGKNFVFDPRRTDPIVGLGITPAAPAAEIEGGRVSVVGRCVVCSSPHDDYDNGRAPCEGGEARCRRCRVLVLVCDGCRSRVRCWGERPGNDDDSRERTELFCGIGGRECVDEGNVAERVETAGF